MLSGSGRGRSSSKSFFMNEYIMLAVAFFGMALVLIGWLLYNQGYIAGAEMCKEIIDNCK
tara:strand:+ start:3314 stop:3493 length:180 start_codon:yes stop_codon:yes gene_type:complete